MKQKTNGGFSLIELMVVVTIIAILASVAYPAYTNSILKGKRAEGRAALAELMLQQERYMTQRNCYLGFSTAPSGVATAASPGTACGGVTPTFTAATFPFKTFSGDSLAKAAYLLEADACPTGGSTASIAECVRVIAKPTGADAEAGSLRMMSTGFKDCAGGNKPSVCWK